MPLVIGEKRLATVIHHPVVTASKGPLGQAVRHVLVLDVGGRKAQFAIHGFHVKGEVTRRGAVKLRVLGREQVQ